MTKSFTDWLSALSLLVLRDAAAFLISMHSCYSNVSFNAVFSLLLIPTTSSAVEQEDKLTSAIRSSAVAEKTRDVLYEMSLYTESHKSCYVVTLQVYTTLFATQSIVVHWWSQCHNCRWVGGSTPSYLTDPPVITHKYTPRVSANPPTSSPVRQ